MLLRGLAVSNPFCTFADVEVGLTAGWGGVLLRWHPGTPVALSMAAAASAALKTYDNMAKGSQIGLLKGKRGNAVYYKVSNSNNKEMQGSRAYTADVTNPKTGNQAGQRIKMAPAVNFYRAFRDEILNHSWQAVKYKGRSHAEFMKKALLMQYGFPYLEIDDQRLVPGEYQMSSGSIPAIAFTVDDDALTCDQLAILELQTTTIREYVDAVTGDLPYLKEGDQLTFAFVMVDSSNNTFPFVSRIILGTTDEFPTDNYPMRSVYQAAGLVCSEDGAIYPNLTDCKVLGAAIIVSRPTFTTGSTKAEWLRSNSFMVVNYDNAWLNTGFFSPEAWDRCVATYMAAGAKAPKSPWYLNHGTTEIQAADRPDAPVRPSRLTFQYAIDDAAYADLTANVEATEVGGNVKIKVIGGASVIDDLTMNNESSPSDDLSTHYTKATLGEDVVFTMTSTAIDQLGGSSDENPLPLIIMSNGTQVSRIVNVFSYGNP